MKLRQLFENIYDVNEGGEEFDNSLKTIGVCFGRWNPPHKGHKAVWQSAATNPIWYVGTNQSTSGPKDPVPYDIKLQLMKAVWPKVAGHVIPEQSLLTLAARIYSEHGQNVHLKVYTDEEWLYKALSQYNGVEKEHGMYNFQQIDWVKTERLASATNLRAAVRSGDRKSFYNDMGIKPSVTVEVNGQPHPVFDVVAHFLNKYPEKTKKAVAESDKHSLIGKFKRGEELYGKVKSSFKDIGDAQKKGDSEAASRAFKKHEKYANLRAPGTWTKTDEIAGAFPSPSTKAKWAADAAASNAAEAKRQELLKAQQLQKNTAEVDKQQKINHHSLAPDTVPPIPVDEEQADPQVRRHMMKKLMKHHGWDLSDLELASDAEIQSEYNKLPDIRELHKKLRINEVAMPLSESSQAKISKRKQQSTAGLNTYSDSEQISGDYTAYRLGMAVAGANGKDPLDMKAKSWIGKKKSTHPYTQEEQDMLKQAYEAVGAEYTDLNAGDLKSKELDSTYKVSPVAKPKRNKYGI